MLGVRPDAKDASVMVAQVDIHTHMRKVIQLGIKVMAVQVDFR